MLKRMIRCALALAICGVMQPISGCSHPQNLTPEDGPSDHIEATPAAASSFGANVVKIEAGEQSTLAGASNRSQTSFYDDLELRVENARLFTYDEFVQSFPGYAEEGWEDRGDRFLLVDIMVSNDSNEPVLFAVDELTLYSDSIKLYDSSPYWTFVLDVALAEQYGSLEVRKTDPGGSWGYPNGWNVIEGNGQKEFSVPFQIYPREVLNGDLEGMSVSDFSLQVYGACSEADVARGVQPSDCYLFALPEKETAQ